MTMFFSGRSVLWGMIFLMAGCTGGGENRFTPLDRYTPPVPFILSPQGETLEVCRAVATVKADLMKAEFQNKTAAEKKEYAKNFLNKIERLMTKNVRVSITTSAPYKKNVFEWSHDQDNLFFVRNEENGYISYTHNKKSYEIFEKPVTRNPFAFIEMAFQVFSGSWLPPICAGTAVQSTDDKWIFEVDAAGEKTFSFTARSLENPALTHGYLYDYSFVPDMNLSLKGWVMKEHEGWSCPTLKDLEEGRCVP